MNFEEKLENHGLVTFVGTGLLSGRVRSIFLHEQKMLKKGNEGREIIGKGGTDVLAVLGCIHLLRFSHFLEPIVACLIHSFVLIGQRTLQELIIVDI